MLRKVVVSLIPLLLLIALVGPVAADRLPGSDQGGRPLTATPLIGAAEVPLGDPDGSGSATFTLNQGQ